MARNMTNTSSHSIIVLRYRTRLSEDQERKGTGESGKRKRGTKSPLNVHDTGHLVPAVFNPFLN